MKVRWHKGTDPRFGYTYWYAEVDGVRVAEARMTSHTGTEDYPWEWYLTDEGEKLVIPAYAKVKTQGVHSTLREIKQLVKEKLGAA